MSEWASAHACLSHYDRNRYGERSAWKRQLKTSPVRVQWDPERSPQLTPLPYRSLQVGLTREAVDGFVDEWMVAIADATPSAHTIRELLRAGDVQAGPALLPVEPAYPLPPDIGSVIDAWATQSPPSTRPRTPTR